MLPNVRKNQRWNWIKYRQVIITSGLGLLAVVYVLAFVAATAPDSPPSPHIQDVNLPARSTAVPPMSDLEKSASASASASSSSSLRANNNHDKIPVIPITLKTKATLAPTPPPLPQQHSVAGLSCTAHGGPMEAAAVQEMVYWKDIPEDASYTTPLQRTGEGKYFTFEPDEGGFNNIRMAMETAIALAIAMGRTLVLPPRMNFYLLSHGVVDYGSFFHIDSIAAEHGFTIISFEEFMQREAMTGHLHFANGTVAFPPQNNRTNWDGLFYNHESTRSGHSKELWEWMRNVTQPLTWKPDDCVAAIPNDPNNATLRMQEYLDQVLLQDSVLYPTDSVNNRWFQRTGKFQGQPQPVDTTPVNRLSELLTNRKEMCVYNEMYQNARVVHGIGETSTGYRLLIHWYAYLFFEDWKQDLHMKRFLRDHFRYKDEIQCGAARLIQAIRKKAMEHGNNGLYDTMHIRRGDFQYHHVKLNATEIYDENTKGIIPEGSTVYIATDESDRTFFEPLAAHYKLLYFSDFEHLVNGVSKNYYGMLDQLVASKGRIFFGTYYSTFTGYINRLRGYHSQNNLAPRYETGMIDSYYYVPAGMKSFHSVMRSYFPVQPGSWTQEYPVAWRLIDTGTTGAPGAQADSGGIVGKPNAFPGRL